jgi:uncharacterized protein with ParB-like and HNH nuclease domain
MATNNLLDTRTTSFSELIGNGRIFKVPPFQRDYSWHPENWEDLWQDILTVHETGESHYMGAVVLQGARDDRTLTIIDGQQRLATLSILAIAIIQKINQLVEKGIEPEANRDRQEILRRTYLGDRDPGSLTYSSKLLLNDNNNGFYQDNLINFRAPRNPRSLTRSEQLLWGAFEYFFEQLEKFSEIIQKGASLSDFLTKTVAKRLLFIQISVEDEINAYVVFETLNSRGVELGATDLLKNYLFSVLRGPDDLHAAQRQWQNITRTVGMEKFPEFLRYFLSMTRSRVRRNQLFKLTRDKIKDPEHVFDLLKQLSDYSDLYVALGKADDEFWEDFNNSNNIREYIRQLNLFRARQVYPALFSAYKTFNEKNFEKLLKLVTVISFRYVIVSGLNPNELETQYNSLAVGISKREIKTPREAFNAVSSLYVSDDKFQQDFSLLSVKRKKNIVKYILSKLEEDEGGSAAEDSFSIEHVLPQEPTEDWLKDFSYRDIDKMIYRLGNMTPLEPSLNRRIDREPYTTKQETYVQSTYLTTKKIQAEDWTADSIVMRQERMAKRAVHIWRIDY